MVYSAEFRAKQSSTTGATSTTAPTIAIPAGAQVGEMLTVEFFTNGIAPVFTPSTVTGVWTQQKQQANSSGGASVTTFTKPCVAGDPGSTQTWAVAPGSRSSNTVRSYKDIDLTTPIDVVIVSGNGSTNTPTAGSETPANPGDISLVTYVCSIAAANPVVPPIYTAPSSYINGETIGTAGLSGAGNCFGASYDKAIPGTGATGPVAAGLDISHSWAAIHMLLRQKTSNSAPLCNAGVDQSVSGGDHVTLTCIASDPDGDTLTLSCGQTGGPPVSLTVVGNIATFVAPNAGGSCVFQWNASDGSATTSDTVTVTVAPRSAWEIRPRVLTNPTDDNTVATATPSMVIPLEVQYGDYLVIDHEVNGIQTCTTPAGWTLDNAQANSANGVTMRRFVKFATATDAGSPVNWTLGSSGRSFITLRAYVDVDQAHPLDVPSATPALGTSTIPTAPTLTSVTDKAYSVVGYATSVAAPAVNLGWTNPTGYGDALVGGTTGASGTGNAYTAGYDKELGVHGPTGTVATSISPSRPWIAMHTLLRPKSANTPPVIDAGLDQVDIEPFSTVTVVVTSLDADGDDVAITLTQDPADAAQVDIIDNGSGVFGFEAPATMDGIVLHFTATGNDGTDTTTNSMTVTVLCHNYWVRHGGVLVPQRRMAPSA